ncbi:MAG: Ig-like domain-containing protein, partial [Terriglobia bacterium]|nr:Ig-like domain-containing protein [Terriglobia bacterium]
MKKLTLLFGMLVLLSVGAARAQIHANVTVNVAQATPTITLASPTVRIVNVGQAVNWQASLQGVPAGAPTGDVLISANAANTPTPMSSGPIPLSSQSSSGGVLHTNPWAMETTISGLFTVQALYQGDTNYTSATSASQQVEVLPPADFSIDAPAAVTIKQGQALSTAITVHSLNNFTGTVNLTCAGMAPLMGCTPSLRSLVLSLPASAYQQLTATPASASSNLTITTTATTVTTVAGGFLLFFFPGVIGRKRKRKMPPAFVLALLGSLLMLAGCGGMRYLQSNGTPRGTYRISITGTSGSLSHTQFVTVT